ncbi:hypothetical protein L207DRAFT_337570 [Hyaloscypha variabilis F]|uniref:Uncharacterized protein n=1 Tax=Hyaloscypha variabilis (strain UAMH 11265 / GT02V1 / F) TaxID=1149755 RepID=A0A2J6RPC8_HYAVF|nr:hypothetical protein L207DRAFT_337570 [Hyaloscypha variabilis F]
MYRRFWICRRLRFTSLSSLSSMSWIHGWRLKCGGCKRLTGVRDRRELRGCATCRHAAAQRSVEKGLAWALPVDVNI